MAYVPTFQTEDEKKAGNTSNIGTPNTSTVLSSGQSGTVGSGGGTSGDQSQRKATGGTGYVNFQKYLKANSENDLADRTSQGLIGQGTDATNKLTSADSSFKTAADKDDLSRGSTEDYRAFQNIKGGNQVYGKDMDIINKYRNASYSGPQSIAGVAGYEDAVSAKDKAIGSFTNSESYEGRLNLLDEMFGRANYTTGQKKLDQALLQGDRNASQKLAAAREKFSGLGSQFQEAQDNSQAYAQKRAQTAQEMQRAALNAIMAGGGAVRKKIEGTAGSLNTQNEQAKRDAIAEARRLYATPENEGLDKYGFNYMDYTGGDVPVYTANDVAGKDSAFRKDYDFFNSLGFGGNYLSPEAQAAKNLGLKSYFDKAAADKALSSAINKKRQEEAARALAEEQARQAAIQNSENTATKSKSDLGSNVLTDMLPSVNTGAFGGVPRW